MPTPTFQRLTIEQFELLLQKFPFTRKIDAVHMHHTWRPRQGDFRGHETIVSMWRHHTQVNKWSDIAQHITVDPDGMIWLGRNWNLPPASAKGHNGNTNVGPFMFEMIGDFDRGRDRFDGPQKDTALKVVALVQQRFGLPAASLRFHNAMSPKSCPGTSVNYDDTLREVERERGELESTASRSSVGATPFPDEADLAIQDAIRALSRISDNIGEGGDAEPEHGERDSGVEPELRAPAGETRGGSGLDVATIVAMRPHLINLRAGRFSGDGEMSSTPEDVDAIFDEHLRRALEAIPEAEKLRILFFAHGGLVSESSGLQIAHKHIDWWRKLGVYPIYFIWETGLFETLAQMLERARVGSRALTRDLADYTTDPIIEAAARALQGPRIWGGMKWSAERAIDPPTATDSVGGGAHYVAAKLKEFCDAHGNRFELHAVGHSAGSIFHANFLPLVHKMGIPTFASAHLMAPAVRVDTFKQQLLNSIGRGAAVQHLTLYTMLRDFERKDNCAHVYRKSLLYLIHHALEDERKTPILGLEESLRSDAELKTFFGLGGSVSEVADVVWSVSASDTGNSASTSTSHGGFDDDPPTMNSIAHRVLGKPDAAAIIPYSPVRAAARQWTEEIDWPYAFVPTPSAGGGVDDALSHTPASPMPQTAFSGAESHQTGSGRRIALCVGVDAYPALEHRLSGCVNDARNWAGSLSALGFETRLMLDGDATRANLARELERLVTESRSGDVIVFQFAGHGTQVPDFDNDEEDSIDEALCPVDFAGGELYIDDDISELFVRIPDGVNMTCFMDCCHSGTNTRFAVGLRPEETTTPSGSKARFVKATPNIVEAYKRLRARTRGAARAAGTDGQRRMRDVKFSACLDHQVALESGGGGEFTRRATRVLGRGIAGMSHDQFLHDVLAEFGSGARQNPLLDCADEARSSGLLQPLGKGGRSQQQPGMMAQQHGAHALLHVINDLARAVQTLSVR